jgi:hypothetical protein
VGRNRGHPWGETVATSGAIQWPPTGSFPWPPSVEFTASFASHAMVMRYGEVLWDPIEDWQRRTLIATGGLAPGAGGLLARAHRPRGVKFFEARHVTYGPTFRRTR